MTRCDTVYALNEVLGHKKGIHRKTNEVQIRVKFGWSSYNSTGSVVGTNATG